MIFKGSRYELLAKSSLTVTGPDGTATTILGTRIIPKVAASFRHTVLSSDRLDLIAFSYYGKADRFWRIADANGAMDPEDLLQVGGRILIPPDQGS